MKILVLEDNEMMRSLLHTLLELEDHCVTSPVFPLDNPLLLIQKERPDVILMDVNLPGINGISLLKSIRSLTDLSEIKIVVSSGSDFRNESQDAGANAFLMKPFMPDELRTIIKSFES